MPKRLSAALSLLALTLALAVSACGGSDEKSGDLLSAIEDKGVLTVSTDPAYPPASELNKDTGEYEGFDIDVATEIAKRLGVDVAWKTPGWDTITAGNWSGRWDVSVGSMTITPERSQVLYFTKPYYYTPASVAVNSDNTTITDPAQLSGKKIGVGVATTYDSYLEGKLSLQDENGDSEAIESVITDPSVRTYETDALALQDLSLGDGQRLDGAITATPIVQGAIDSDSHIKIIGEPLYYEPLAVAADRSSELDSQSLVDKISDIIAEMHEDGTLSKLSKKWYGIDYSVSS
jgi:polar amino acid transport system substrate-binding protein